ncbi:hypothetical protein [Streptomyces sp. NPDC050534]|uniref:hypothetical protein n=1 Tax=Streptomyces sp. NPDC050534 TaxID=3365625 RepID=UPI0037BB2365
MTDDVQQLTSQQVADLRRQFNERAAQGLGTILRHQPAPPLPPCPACDVEPERIDYRVEDPKFDVYEPVLRFRWLPCGHRFRGAVDPNEVPSVEECETTARRVLEFGAPRTVVYGAGEHRP